MWSGHDGEGGGGWPHIRVVLAAVGDTTEGVARHAVDPRSALALVFVRCAGPISRPWPMRRVSSLESALFKE